MRDSAHGTFVENIMDIQLIKKFHTIVNLLDIIQRSNF
jgi:septin family protein